MKRYQILLPMVLALAGLLPTARAALKTLPGHVPSAVAHLSPVGRLASSNRLDLAIGLPLRNQPALHDLLRGLYDPASPGFHHYLTPEEFTAQFGPTAQDYQSLIHWAQTNGLAITHTHGNRVLLDVSGRVADIERAFHVTLRTYQHPTEARKFYAPDVEPSVAAGLPILDISGLSDFAIARPLLHHRPAAAAKQTAAGSGPGNGYIGLDFRNAYVPGTPLDGSGQMVGLLELTGYDPNDITAYETQANLPNVPLQNVLLDGFPGFAGNGEDEVCLDIEMAVSMATNLAKVVVFEAPSPVYWNDILNAMASSNQIRQFSSSWGLPSGVNQTGDQIFQQMAAEGQSFFQASGDGDAWTSPIWQPSDSPYLTSVGGTTLFMTDSGADYSAEQVWNWGYQTNAWSGNGNGYWGSGGGVSANYAIPSWQTNVNMAASLGSTTLRNIPDVALTADNVYLTFGSGSSGIAGGTSCAAPLWAGFMALVNEQAAILGRPSAGFINPAIYALAATTNYTACFHDIVTGSNAWSGSPDKYFAVPGYDLCTGLGTPSGTNLVNALAATSTTDFQQLVRDGGFETGYFTDWVLFGNTVIQAGPYTWFYNYVMDSSYGNQVIHSGNYGAFLGDGTVAILEQGLPTSPGQEYLLSFWLDNPRSGFGQFFEVNWNTNDTATNTIFSLSSPPVISSWTNLNFVLTATGTNTMLQFGAQNDAWYFGLDDVSVVPIPPPSFSATASTAGGPTFSWQTVSNVSYVVQYTTNLLSPAWLNLAGPILAATNTLTVTDTNALSNSSRFYRVAISP